jgi:DNA-binding XRE family transcriptional regulator
MKISRLFCAHETSVHLNGDDFSATIRLRSRGSKRHRRQILLSFFRLARPHFPSWQAAHLSHSDSSILDMVREMNRPVSLYQALNLRTPRGQEGFRIRTQRLGYGKTQRAFAELAQVNRSQLSRIEHGQLEMSPYFRARIELAFKKLSIQETKTHKCPRGKRGRSGCVTHEC